MGSHPGLPEGSLRPVSPGYARLAGGQCFVMVTDQAAYEELCYYTLAHGDPAFIHQHVVDAFAAQTADENIKPIK